MSRPVAIVCAVVVAWGLQARAAERPKLVVVPFVALEGASDAAAAKFQVLVADELKKRGDSVELTPAPSAARPASTEKASAQRSAPNPAALASLEAGKKAFDDLRFEEAVKELRSGIEGLLADPGTADYEAVLDAEVKLAAACFRMGEEKDAKGALNDLVRLSPSHQLQPGFPPVFLRELEKAKKRIDKQPRGQISVEGPAGATAFVDGRDLGMVPVLEENIPAGLHYVKVESTKGERFGQAVEVKGATARVKASFGAGLAERAPANSAPEPRIGATLDDGTRDRLSAYARAAGADYLLTGVVFRVSDAQLSAGTALFSLRRGAFALLAGQVFDTDVLTANTEAFKLADDVTAHLGSFGAPAGLPLALVARPKAAAVVARIDPVKVVPAPSLVRPDKKNAEDLEVAAPVVRKVSPPARQVVLTPKEEVRALEHPSTVVEFEKQAGEEPDGSATSPAVTREGAPAWVWVVTGAVVAGAAAGGYFGYTAMTKPVTGTVMASW